MDLTGLPQQAIDLLMVFSEEERDSLIAWYDDDTREFSGIGFVNKETELATKFSEPQKAAAIVLLEKMYREEIRWAYAYHRPFTGQKHGI